MEISCFVGKRLLSLRKQKGWTQEQVAETLNMSQSAYSRMELGQSNSWISRIMMICKIDTIEIHELFLDESLLDILQPMEEYKEFIVRLKAF